MPKNRTTRAKKLARQGKARARRQAVHTTIDVAKMFAAFEQVAIAGLFPVAGPDGETRQVPYQHVVDWHNAELAADGEPLLGPGELTQLLIDDVMFGHLRLRSDGLWESSQPYFTAGAEA
ncbi:MAG: hypothetical protein HOV92_21435 [Streptomyces sp.]|nr:hypothetical protein [Streptomyces sp.]